MIGISVTLDRIWDIFADELVCKVSDLKPYFVEKCQLKPFFLILLCKIRKLPLETKTVSRIVIDDRWTDNRG